MGDYRVMPWDLDEHWAPTDESPVVRCDHCGEVRPCVHAPSPFIGEVHPERDNPPSYWCRPCWRACLYEI